MQLGPIACLIPFLTLSAAPKGSADPARTLLEMPYSAECDLDSNMTDVVVEQIYFEDSHESEAFARSIESLWNGIASRGDNDSSICRSFITNYASGVLTKGYDTYQKLFRERHYKNFYRLDVKEAAHCGAFSFGDPRVLIDTNYLMCYIQAGDVSRGDYLNFVLQPESQHMTISTNQAESPPFEAIYRNIATLPVDILGLIGITYADAAYKPIIVQALKREAPFYRLLRPDPEKINRSLSSGDAVGGRVLTEPFGRSTGFQSVQFYDVSGKRAANLQFVFSCKERGQHLMFAAVRDRAGKMTGLCAWERASDGAPRYFVNIYANPRGELRTKIQHILHFTISPGDRTVFSADASARNWSVYDKRPEKPVQTKNGKVQFVLGVTAQRHLINNRARAITTLVLIACINGLFIGLLFRKRSA
jgi:hypothetical protein